MSTAEKRYITPAEYLAVERSAEFKSEYFQGEVFAMVGASRRHNLIVGNLFADVHRQLKHRQCESYASDMRVKVSPTGLYTYPDVVIVCDEPAFEDAELDTLLNPNAIVEVLSDSTEAYDRGAKFEQYRRLESLHDYVLVAQDRVHIEHFARDEDGSWVLTEIGDTKSTLELSAVACHIAVPDIYAKVDLESK